MDKIFNKVATLTPNCKIMLPPGVKGGIGLGQSVDVGTNQTVQVFFFYFS